MNSISFICERLQKTAATQAALATGIGGNPPWVWPRKTVVQWTADVTLLDQLKAAEVLKRTEWRNAAALWDGKLRQIQKITRDVKREGLVHFRDDADRVVRFVSPSTNGVSRDDLYNQGDDARAAWQTSDPRGHFSRTLIWPVLARCWRRPSRCATRTPPRNRAGAAPRPGS